MVSQDSVDSQSASWSEGAPPPLLVDAMLGRLARWLRLAGYDTEFWRDGTDEQLIAAARAQGRLIVTKDRALAARRAVAAVRVDADDLDEQIAQVRGALGKFGAAPEPFTRCAACNGAVAFLSRDAAEGLVAPYVWHTQPEFRRCERCGRVYWKGTHWPAVCERLSVGSDVPPSQREGADRL